MIGEFNGFSFVKNQNLNDFRLLNTLERYDGNAETREKSRAVTSGGGDLGRMEAPGERPRAAR